MQEPVLHAYPFQKTLRAFQRRPADDAHGRILQCAVREIRESHQILVVLVPASFQNSIPVTQIQLAKHPAEQVLRHVLVIDKSQRLAFPAAFETFRYLLQDAAALIVVYLHLRITGKLESVCAERHETVALKHLGQTAAHHVIYVHDVAASLLVRQTHKTAAIADRQAEIGIVIHHLSGLTVPAGLYCQIYLLIRLVIQMLYRRQPYRNDKSVHLFLIVMLDIRFLLLIGLSI